MPETILVSMPVEDLKNIIQDAVKNSLTYPPTQHNTERFLTEKQACELFDIPYPTLQTLIKKSEIPIRILGKHCYFSFVDLMLWRLQLNMGAAKSEFNPDKGEVVNEL